MPPTENENVVKLGDIVKVEYTGTLDDGTVFDDSKQHDAPLEFRVGTGDVIEGFEKAVIGMKINQQKTVKLKPAQAYGLPDPTLIKKVPKAELPQEDLEIGTLLGYVEEDGQEITGVVTEIKGDIVTIDLNHPLAGENLTFKLKLIAKENCADPLPSQDEEDEGHGVED